MIAYAINSTTEAKKEFYEMVGDFLLQKKQREIIGSLPKLKTVLPTNFQHGASFYQQVARRKNLSVYEE